MSKCLYFQGKLELITGGNASTMNLELYSQENALIGKLDNNAALLGSYPIDDGMRIHVSPQHLPVLKIPFH